jgi:uncharacterized protein (DUF4415 family)
MKKQSIVKYTLDLKNPPPLTAAQRKRLKRLAAMPDSEIDYSDIPPLTGKEKWTRPGALVPAGNKAQITLRIDADVLKFFKATGRRYQSRINAALREYISNATGEGGSSAAR